MPFPSETLYPSESLFPSEGARVEVPVTLGKMSGAIPVEAIDGEPNEEHRIPWNDGRIFLEVQNTDSEAHWIRLLTPRTDEGMGVEDPEVSIPAGKTMLFGPFLPQFFNQEDGAVWVDVASTKLKLRAVGSSYSTQ